MKNIFKGFLKKERNIIKRYLQKREMTQKLYRSPYKFSKEDIDSFWASAAIWDLGAFPTIHLIRTEDGFSLYDVGGYQIWWPCEFDHRGLGSIWNEVHLPFNVNGHAYEYRGARLEPGDWVIDAGASEGFFTQVALERQANVLIVEPVTSLIHALERTFANEIKQGRVKLVHGLLGDTNTTRTFSVLPDTVFSSGVETYGAIGVTQTETCRQYTIDYLCGNVIPHVNFIKMDIEGGEVASIKGAKETIKNLRPKLSICTYHEVEHARDIASLVLQQCDDYEVETKGIMMLGPGREVRPAVLHAF